MYSLLVGCSRYWSDVVTHMHESTVHIFVLTQFLKIWPMDKISRAEGKLVRQMAAENACRRLEIGAAQTWHDLFSAFVSDNWTWDQLAGWTNLRCRLQVLIYQHISARTKQHGDSTHLVVGGALHLLFKDSVRWPSAQGIGRQVNVVIGSPLAKLEQDVLYIELSF